MQHFGAQVTRTCIPTTTRPLRAVFLIGVASVLCSLAFSGQAAALDPTVVGVGDMACSQWNPNYNSGNGTATACRQKYVSDVAVNLSPNALLDLGDNQYDNGELVNYQTVYDPTFGRANPVVYPSLGNAEYDTPNAQGFFDYFSSVGVTARIGASGADTGNYSSGYYSFNIGAWHLIALNSNCAEIGGCGLGSPQEMWLKSDLAAHPNHCTVAYWHHPRWNSGNLGDDSSTAAFWTDLYNAHADLVLNGHGNHHYERFTPQSPSGIPDANGVREFIVSTGGESHGTPPTGPGDSTATTQISDYTSYGVLKLTLHPSSYDWQFVPEVGGSFTDSGTANCHAASAQRPGPPSLSATPADSSVHLSWSTPSDGGAPITGYNVYRGTSAGGETLLQGLGNVTSYDDGTAVNGTKYYYRVAAVNNVGEGTQSNEVSATPSSAPPPPLPFPRTGLLDDFARPAGALGTNWQSPALQDGGTVTIKSSGLTGSSSGAGSATWSPGTFGADQEAYLGVPTLPAAGNFMQLAGRVSTQSSSNVSCYFLRVTPSSSTWDLRKKINGAASTSIKTFTAPFVAGDGAGLQIIGSTLTAYRKPGAGAWVSIGSTTDTSIPGSGYVSFTLGDTTMRGGGFGGGTVTTAQPPAAPSLSATAADASVHLSWTAPSNGGAAITAYNIYRGTSAGGETLLKSVANVTSADDNTVVNGTKYYYRVSAVNSLGEGTLSNEVSGTPSGFIALDDVSKPEGDSGQSDFSFTVSLTNPSSQTVTVDYQTQDGTATTADSDYTAASGTLTFDPGQTTKTVSAKVNGDTVFEPDEGFTLKLQSATGAAIADSAGQGTIQNDDTQPALALDDVSKPEGDSGQSDFSFTVSLTNPSSKTVTVDYQTQDGTATTADSDYSAASGTLTFDPGQTTKTVSVKVNGDTTVEPDEDFALKLSTPANATIADDTGVGTIGNDDHGGFARAKGATPLRASLGLAYQPCDSPNHIHGDPLTVGSCDPPVQASSNLTVGTLDANGSTPNFTGSVRLDVCAATGCGGSDLGVRASLTDVRCQSGVATCDSTPNLTGGADYTGELELDLSVRLTDKDNAVAPGVGTDPATVEGFTFPATISCQATVDVLIGAQCELSTSANALMPGSVADGTRANWQLDQIKVDDAGPDGLVSTPEGAAPFAVQGLFVP
jgi:acid phosphatase type 7